jgi:ribosomal protein S1
MARFQYDIVPIPQGWQVNCNGVLGAPYSDMSDAVLDTLATADQLCKQGDKVEVRLLQLDGTRRVLETRDARLYSRRP